MPEEFNKTKKGIKTIRDLLKTLTSKTAEKRTRMIGEFIPSNLADTQNDSATKCFRQKYGIYINFKCKNILGLICKKSFEKEILDH